MLVGMAAETTVALEMPYMAEIRGRFHFHRWESIVIVCILDGGDGFVNILAAACEDVLQRIGIKSEDGRFDRHHGRILVGEGVFQSFHCSFLDIGDILGDSACNHGIVNIERGRAVKVGGTVVAIHAVHRANRKGVQGFFVELVLFILVNTGFACFQVGVAHPGNGFPVFRTRDVFDLEILVDMPVDPFGEPESALLRTYLHDHGDVPLGIGFICKVSLLYTQGARIKFLGPVAAFAGFPGGTQVCNRSGDGGGIFMKEHRIHLVQTREF